MEQNSFDAIIFDLGGVIINLDYQLTIEAFKKLGIDNFEEMYTQAKQNNLFDDFETGKISSQHFINSLLPFLPSGTSANKVVHAWNAMILDFPKKRLELLDQLNSKYRVFLLSNTNDIHLQAVNRSLANTTDRKLDTYFEKVYLSHEVKLRKPHKEIFELVCTEQNLNPETTIFIDDTIGHVNGANSIGLKGIHLVDKTIEEMFAFN
jgi:HAD superfamily hydrolase (TIGR01509 family)